MDAGPAEDLETAAAWHLTWSLEKSSNAIAQHRQLNRYKKILFPWMYEVSKCCAQEALRDLDRAYKDLFEGRMAGSESQWLRDE